MKFEKIEKDLTNLLLRDIVIYINPAKPLKQGKLKLFTYYLIIELITLQKIMNI